MEERKNRIKGLYDMMAQMDEEGQDVTKIAATCLEIGREIGRSQAEQKHEQKENRDPQ